MKKQELKQRLIYEQIPINSYWLDEGGPCLGEVYCLSKNKNTWEVYYSERGQKTNLKVFDEEETACDYFYDWLIKSLRRMKLIN